MPFSYAINEAFSSTLYVIPTIFNTFLVFPNSGFARYDWVFRLPIFILNKFQVLNIKKSIFHETSLCFLMTSTFLFHNFEYANLVQHYSY